MDKKARRRKEYLLGPGKSKNFSTERAGYYSSSLSLLPASTYIEHSSIADSPYIEHCSVFSLVDALSAYPNFDIEFFDNTLVLMFDFDLISDEGASQEEGKGN